MKNVERIEGTDFYGLNTGNHGKIGDPHPQYGQAPQGGRDVDGHHARQHDGRGHRRYGVYVHRAGRRHDLRGRGRDGPGDPGGVTVYVATLYLDSVAQSPNLAVQSTSATRMLPRKTWVLTGLTPGVHSVLLRHRKLATGGNTWTVYSNSQLLVKGP
ncbi:hypothetical protein [Rhodococcus jostii]|uniref:Uncharacterized protein n=1 Tax=Rhodococcus jostii TaxID=132919 RepID=A0ABU4CBI3_RHOJO|nr:hypothetical protein [Rhodococcus jostii]MDV6280645.1 hypothetical protein [Rhodococcus jostii]